MTEQHSYQHKVQYYETDQMGIVHHSNYIRWFEEARTDFLEKIGIPYHVVEEAGIISPVLSVECKYKSKVKYGETVTIETTMIQYTGLRMRIRYAVYGSEGKLRSTGETSHCFVNEKGRPVSLKKVRPEWDELFSTYLEEPQKTK